MGVNSASAGDASLSGGGGGELGACPQKFLKSREARKCYFQHSSRDTLSKNQSLSSVK